MDHSSGLRGFKRQNENEGSQHDRPFPHSRSISLFKIDILVLPPAAAAARSLRRCCLHSHPHHQDYSLKSHHSLALQTCWMVQARSYDVTACSNSAAVAARGLAVLLLLLRMMVLRCDHRMDPVTDCQPHDLVGVLLARKISHLVIVAAAAAGLEESLVVERQIQWGLHVGRPHCLVVLGREWRPFSFWLREELVDTYLLPLPISY